MQGQHCGQTESLWECNYARGDKAFSSAWDPPFTLTSFSCCIQSQEFRHQASAFLGALVQMVQNVQEIFFTERFITERMPVINELSKYCSIQKSTTSLHHFWLKCAQSFDPDVKKNTFFWPKCGQNHFSQKTWILSAFDQNVDKICFWPKHNLPLTKTDKICF